MNLRRSSALGWIFAVGLAWLWTWKHLAQGWLLNPQYQYGFIIPWLFGWMVYRRWRQGEWTRTGNCSNAWMPLAVAGWGALFFGELLRRQDPIWRLAGGLLLLGSTLLTLAWFWRLGGRGLVRRELFPAAFAWLALTWPVPLEQAVTLKLLALATWLATTLANLVGISALQHGNIIELAHGFIGMGKACSGIESFQASLVASLFLGEVRGLGFSGRILLVAGGWLIAFGINLARIFTCILLVNAAGQAALAQWHDLIGALATGFTYSGALCLAMCLPGRIPIAPSRVPPVAPAPEGWAICAAVILVPLLAAGWFAALFTAELPTGARWKVDPGKLPAHWSWHRRNPSVAERAALQFSSWDCILVRTPEGGKAQLIHLYWEPGKSMPAMAFSHSPALCLSESGWILTTPPKPVFLMVHGKRIGATRFELAFGNVKQTVYQILAQGSSTEPFAPSSSTRSERFSLLWREPKRQVTEELLLAFQEFGDEPSPEQSAETLLETLLIHLGPVFQKVRE